MRRTLFRLDAGGDAFYKLLGVRRDQELPKIKQEFRTLAKKMHPDMNPHLDEEGKTKLARTFADMSEAWRWIEKHHTTEVNPIHEIKKQALRKQASTSHPQDKRPVVSFADDFEEKPKNTAAQEQAKQFLRDKQRVMRGGSIESEKVAEQNREMIKPRTPFQMPSRPKRRTIK